MIVSAISNWVAVAVGIGVGLVLTPFIIVRLGPGGHGVWVLVGTILMPLGLLELGVPAAVSRQTAFYAARGDYSAVNRVVSSAMSFFAVGGGLIVLFAILVAGPLASFFGVTPENTGEFRVVAVILGLAVAMNLIGQVFRAAIQGHERFVVRNFIAIASHVVRAGLTVALLLGGHGLTGVALASLLADLLVFIACYAYVRVRLRKIRVDLRRASFGSLWPLITFGLTTFVIAGADVLRGQLNIAVAGRMIGVQAVSVYGIAFLLLRYYAKVIFSGFGVLTPRLSAMAGLDAQNRARRLLVRSLWICSALSGIGAVLLMTLGPGFIGIWVPKPGYELAAVVLMITAGTVYFELAQFPAFQALYALNRHRFLAVVRVLEAGCNVGLSVALAPHLGLIGVAIGMAGPQAFFNVFIQPIFIRQLVGVSLLRYAAPMFVCAAAGGLILLVWHSVLARLVSLNSYWSIVLAGLAITAACLLIGLLALLLWRRGQLRTAASGHMMLEESA